ncbi:MAG TPA: PAS domain S-box protein [Isosphaeraceae bacterium]|nr:PAS domain S-box protein [Isosphaeraceae bacterium]
MIEEADTGLDKLRPTFLAARGTNGMEVTMVGPSIAENIEFFRLIVDQAPDAIIVADRQGQIQIWNHTAADLFGFRPDEAIGRSLDIIIPEHLRQAHWEGFQRAVASGVTKHWREALKTRATHKTGRKVYVSLAFSVLKNRDGQVLGAMATAREFIEEPKLPKGEAG